MRNIYVATLLLFGLAGWASGQSLTLHDTVKFPAFSSFLGDVGNSDVWGYTAPDGVEYAIMGTYEGIAVVRAVDGLVIDEIPGPKLGDPYYHRDIKTLGHYAYAVAEMAGVNEGIMILDLQYLPDSVRFVGAYKDSLQIYSHNLAIDTATGFAYVEAQGDTGIAIYDLAAPESPAYAGFVRTVNTHDMFVRNDTAWVAEGWSAAYSVWDVSDKQNHTMITRITDPAFGYCHNIWPSDNGRFFYTTEETSGKTVKCWEMVNANNIVKRGEYLAPCNLAHNVHVDHDLVWLSHYESGVAVVDFSDPDNPVELARYDTYPQSENDDFLGSWGVYPHTQNGMVYASNFDGKLTILNWNSTVSNESGMVAPETAIEFGPHPVTDRVTFRNTGNKDFSRVKILDIQGKTMLDAGSPFRNGEWTWQPGSNIPSGTYFLQFTGPDAYEVIRINRL